MSTARWQVPDVDEKALALAKRVRRASATLGGRGGSAAARWSAVLQPLAGPLEDGDLRDVRLAANRVRAAFGVGDSVAEELDEADARAMRDAVDVLLRALDHHEARAAREAREPRAGSR